MEILRILEAEVTPIVNQSGAELIDIIYRREAGTMVLRLIVDKPGGITLDELTAINRHVGDDLDKSNVVSDAYTLEVSSPGLDRALKTRKDYERAMGRTVRVHTYGPVDGMSEFIGSLVGLSQDSIVVESIDGIAWELPLEKIAVCKLHVDF